jgi:hypothetical protein
LKRWAEHFRELLNCSAPETPLDIIPAETELPINCNKPSRAEIRSAIVTLLNGKAAAQDNIPSEANKADTETAVAILQSLFNKIWEKWYHPSGKRDISSNCLKRRPQGLKQLSRHHDPLSAG